MLWWIYHVGKLFWGQDVQITRLNVTLIENVQEMDGTYTLDTKRDFQYHIELW
jgi:hypothetical protein